jgi:F-box protein 9
MFLDRVRVRTEGMYVSRNTYVKAGMTDVTTDNINPCHLVAYYRYFRFFNTGEFYCKTSPQKIESVARTFKDRRAAAMDNNMYYGWYSTAVVDGEDEDESRQVLLYFSYGQLA